MDQETNDSDKSKHTYHDVCADTNTNVELDAIGEVMSDHIWNKLTDQQKEIIELLNKGITCNQIAEMWNMTGANVRFKLKTLRIRLEKLGIYKPINNETVINRSLGRKVSIEGKVYKSITEASKELNIKDNTINGRLKSISDKFKEWQYVN
jgi:transcriptional regulator